MPGYVAVCGPADPEEPEVLEQARTAGRLLAERGWVVLTGGKGGVMGEAAAAAAAAGATVVGLLPGDDRAGASPGHTIVIPTGMGEMRNVLLVRAADAVLAVGGSWGTLSEIALAARTGVPVFTVAGWQLPGSHGGPLRVPAVTECASVEEAVELIAVAVR